MKYCVRINENRSKPNMIKREGFCLAGDRSYRKYKYLSQSAH